MYMSDAPKAPGWSCCCRRPSSARNSERTPVSSKTSRTAVAPGGVEKIYTLKLLLGGRKSQRVIDDAFKDSPY
ncbi:hypothetical protein EYF80_057051 [Liparis tanakae]|uniref:Uncharacterized protein n=1 Tax=Liparis tanakae TaxID=230148 RepID=A0A4Z2EV22_9TELE|nr:hypothetical protein EYF80_057051 [Liparis tanakae]